MTNKPHLLRMIQAKLTSRYKFDAESKCYWKRDIDCFPNLFCTDRKKKKNSILYGHVPKVFTFLLLYLLIEHFFLLINFFPFPFIFISWRLITLHMNFYMVQYYVALIIFPLKSTLNKMAYLKHALITPGFRSHM